MRYLRIQFFLFFGFVAMVYGGEIRRVHLLQDDAQYFMVSKVYELKHVAANDIAPFILTAVALFEENSKVDRMRYPAGKQEFLIVSTPPEMMPYVDEMVAALDRPSKIIDKSGSGISGTGMGRFSYMPRHRSSDAMVNIANRAISWNGMVFRDRFSNIIYWKDTWFVGELIGMWLQLFDRPLPQVELQFKIYQCRKSTLQDLGVDYLAWKNGPGLNFFATGLQTTVFDSVEKTFSNMNQRSAWSFGGLYFAPQFDASFIRMLSQQGEANIVATAAITIVNAPAGEYALTFIPAEQNIVKDEAGRMAVINGDGERSLITVKSPIICFRRNGEMDGDYQGEESDYTLYAPSGGNIRFDYNLSLDRVVEHNNLGVELTEQSSFQSTMTFDLGGEHLLAVAAKNQQVEQTIGMPFLSAFPVLKYLFSTTETINEENEIFVTVQGRLVHPEDSMSGWSGKLIDPKLFLNSRGKNE